MVTELLARVIDSRVFEKPGGRISIKLVHIKDPMLFRERVEVQVEKAQEIFHPYSVYPPEVKGLRRAERIARKEYRHFAKKFN